MAIKHPVTEFLERLRSANLKRQAEWDPEGKITLSYRGNELAGETGEACNFVKKLERKRLGIRGTVASAEDVARELADVIICADLIAMELRIDLQDAVRQKFNEVSKRFGLSVLLDPEEVCRVCGRQINPTTGFCSHEMCPRSGAV